MRRLRDFGELEMKILQVLILIFVIAVSVNAQKAVLSGTVTDDMGALIPQGKIDLIDETGKKFSALTNDEGEYKIQIDEGTYKIEVEFSPFQKFVIFEYRITPSGKMRLDVALICDVECRKRRSH